MKRHSDAELAVPATRYHTQGTDKLYQPIRFLFVTDKMAADILAEREAILGMTSPALQERQRKLLMRYDPHCSAQAFHQMLRLFAVEQGNR